MPQVKQSFIEKCWCGGLVGGEVTEAVRAVSLRNENVCGVWGGRDSDIQIFESDIEKN